MGCFHSSDDHPSEISAIYEDENSLTLIDKYASKIKGEMIVQPRTKVRSEDTTYNGLFKRTDSSKITFSKNFELRAYIPGWTFFITTIILKISTYSPFRLYFYGYCEGKWILILEHVDNDRGTAINFSIFTAKSMKEGSLNKLYSAIGIIMHAPEEDKFCVEQFYLFGQLFNRSCKISQEILEMPMGHEDESTDYDEESNHKRSPNEKRAIDVCDQCRLTCIACGNDIDIVNPGKRGYICNSCYKKEYKNYCFLCGSKLVHKNIGRLCQQCTEKSVGVTECAKCNREFPIS